MTRAVLLVFAAIELLSPVFGRGDDWFRTAIPGFTVYSDLPEAETRQRLAGLLLAMEDFNRVWPTPQLSAADPALIVFCNQPQRYSPLVPDFVHNPVLLHAHADAFFNTRYRPPDGYVAKGDPYQFKYPPLLDNWDTHLLQRVYSAYFQRLLGEREPPWLNYGLCMLIQGMCCKGDTIEFPALTTDPTLSARAQTRGSAASLEAAVARGQFYPLDELFTTQKRPPLQWNRYFAGHSGRYLQGPDNRSFWHTLPSGPAFLNEAYELAYYGLFADGGTHRANFIRFAVAASNGAPDEALAKESFGMDGAALQQALWHCTAFARDEIYRTPRNTSSNVPTPGELIFRPATRNELIQMAQTWKAAKGILSARGSVSNDSFDDLFQAIHSLY